MDRRCLECSGEMPTIARRHAQRCSVRCRVTASRRRKPKIPAELIRRARWVRHDAAKRPLTAVGRPASSTDSVTWTDHATVAASRAGVGVGFVLDGDGIVCIDLDHCLVDGQLHPIAARIVAAADDTYVEVSPSGDGLHVWGTASGPIRGRRLPGGVEVYGNGRYITVTGRRWSNAPATLGDITAAIAEAEGIRHDGP